MKPGFQRVLATGTERRADDWGSRPPAQQGKSSAATRRTRRGLTLLVAILLAAPAAGLAVLFLDRSYRRPPMPATELALPVKTVVAAQAGWPLVVSVPGTVSAVNTATLASRSGGWVTKVAVDAGAHVTQGELLAEVGSVDLRSQLAQAEARLNTAQAAFDLAQKQETRYGELYRKQFTTAEQYETIQNNFLSAKAEVSAATLALTAAKSDIDYADIRAPFAGIVAQKNIWPGDYEAPGAPLFVLAGNMPEIRAQVGAATFRALEVGDSAEVVIDGRQFPAVVTRLVAAADPTTRTHLVELHLQGSTTAPFGAYAEVHLSLGQFRALAVPAIALTRRAGLLSVFVVDKNRRAYLRLVRTGEREVGRVAIVAGLKAGESVIVDPSSDLANGALVTPERAALVPGDVGVNHG